MIRRLSHKLHLPILLITTMMFYAVTLKHGFVWDDHIYVVGKEAYKEFDLRKIFFSMADGVEYLPISDISLAIDYTLWGTNPAGFHLTNIIIFLFNIWFVYLIAEQLPFVGKNIQDRKSVAFLAALLYAVHPINSEAVNFISCRNVLLSGAILYLAIIIYIRYLTDYKHSAFVHLELSLCFLAALLSKATAIVLPLVLFLLAMTVRSDKTTREKVVVLIPPFVMAGLFFIFYREIGKQNGIISEHAATSITEKMAISMQIPFFYLKKLMIPGGFSAEYASDKFTSYLGDPASILAFISLTMMTMIAVKLRYKAPLFGFTLCWYIITLLPVLNFFSTNPVVADRYAYLPAFPFVYMTASLLTTLRQNYTTGVIVVLIAVLGGITYSRSLEWRSDVALWQANIRTEPTNGKGYQNLFAEALIAKDIGLAQTLLAEARSKAPAASNDYMEGMIYFMQYDNIPALKLFENAVRQDKNHIRSLLNIGIIYQEMGNLDKAVEYYNRTIRADAPDGWGCRENARKRLEVINTKPR